MNLTYVETFLTNCISNSPEFILKEVKKLLIQIKEYKQKEECIDNVYNIFPILDSFNKRYLNLIQDYSVIIKEGNYQQKIDNVQELLCVLSCLDYYITDLLNRPELEKQVRELSANKNNGNYLRQLASQKELIKSEKFLYSDILKSLRNELWAQVKKIEIGFEKSKIK